LSIYCPSFLKLEEESTRDKTIPVSRQALIQEMDSLSMTRILKGQGIEGTYRSLEEITGHTAMVCL
jgi:hypothetical protein